MNTIEQGICETYQSLTGMLCPFEKPESCMVEKCIAEAIFWKDTESPLVHCTKSHLIVLRDI